MKKRILSFLLTLSVILQAAAFNFVIATAAPGTEEFNIIGIHSASGYDGAGRLALVFKTDYDGKFTNLNVRNSHSSISVTVGINEQDYTFGVGKYIVAFAQEYFTDSDYFKVYLKRDPGTKTVTNNVPGSYYSEDYPGITRGEKQTVTFYAGTCIGIYKLMNDVTVEVSADDQIHLKARPHALTVNGGTAQVDYNTYKESNTYFANAYNTVTVTPKVQSGGVFKGVSFLDGEGNSVDVDYVINTNGSISLQMPDHPLTVNVESEEIFYNLTLGDTVLPVQPFKAIGDLPEGRWAIDGCEISALSSYVWDGDKVAQLLPEAEEEEIYNVTLIDGDKTYYRTYTLSNKNIIYPELEKKQGYISSWEEVVLDGGDKTIHAVYTPITFTVTLMVDGELYATIEVSIETDVLTLPPVPYKEGYRVFGWGMIEFPKYDVTLNAIYIAER